MTLKLDIDVPDSLAEKARQAGLLQREQFTAMLERELERQKALADFREMLQQLRAVDDEPMSLEEIQVEVDAVREEMARQREGRR